MTTLFRRWRILTLAQRVIGFARICVLLRAALMLVQTVLAIWKRKGR